MASSSFHLEKTEYRSAIRFCVLLKWQNQEILDKMNAAYGDQCPSRSTILFWAAEFRHGRQNVTDEPRDGRPVEAVTSQHSEEMEKLLIENRRISVASLSEQLKVSRGSVGTLLKNAGYRKVSSRFVPRFLTPDMRANRMAACQQNLGIAEQYGERFLHNILTVDESPLSLYNPLTKRESSEWRKPTERKPLKMRSGTIHRRCMTLTVFFNASEIVLIDFLPRQSTVTGDYYSQLIHNARALTRKPRGLPHWFLQDNAPAHTSGIAQQAINAAGFTVLNHPPYSPDLSPSDFWLYRILKKHLRGKIFESSSELEACVREFLNELTAEDLKTAFNDLKTRWNKCVLRDGDWFEK